MTCGNPRRKQMGFGGHVRAMWVIAYIFTCPAAAGIGDTGLLEITLASQTGSQLQCQLSELIKVRRTIPAWWKPNCFNLDYYIMHLGFIVSLAIFFFFFLALVFPFLYYVGLSSFSNI